MNVNKKLDRFRQWGKEKVGASGDKTDTPEGFKALEAEMDLRHQGMEKLHNSANGYVKNLTKRTEGDAKEKQTPIGYLGSAMAKHGEDFEDGSKFGECLMGFGQANQRVARLQDSFAQNATSSWLEACERSLAQMKDYQTARKKLESRRLAYDTSLAKMQKAKKEDYRTEDELRSQKAKYEESTEEVSRRMQDIIDAENDNVTDLYSFLEAEITYHDRSREVLMQLKQEWPLANESDSSPPFVRRSGTNSAPRSRQNTLSRLPSNPILEDSDLEPPSLPFRSRNSSGRSSPFREPPSPTSLASSKPSFGRSGTTDSLPLPRPNIGSRTATEASMSRTNLRPTPRPFAGNGTATPNDDESYADEMIARSSSPASYGTGNGSAISRNTSWGTLAGSDAQGRTGVKKAPPPPPPSRASKPKPPPPPPLSRNAASSSQLPY